VIWEFNYLGIWVFKYLVIWGIVSVETEGWSWWIHATFHYGWESQS